MSGGVWSFYDPASGIFTGRRFSGSEKNLSINTPAGSEAVPGRHDPLSMRVDTTTGQVIDYQPPAPDDEHEWNATRRRWVKKPEAIAAERRDAAARKRIAEIESSQQRAIREYTLGDASALDRLRAADEEIKGLRSDLI